MIIKKANHDSQLISEVAVHGIKEKKGHEIICLDLQKIHSSVADYFVICHAESSTQVKAIARSIEEEIVKTCKEEPWRREGFEQGEWIILDYVSVVVHIFKKEKRYFYGVEELWGDAEVVYQEESRKSRVLGAQS